MCVNYEKDNEPLLDGTEPIYQQPCENLGRPHRYLCDALSEIRGILDLSREFVLDDKNHILTPVQLYTLRALVEEVQVYASRMEDHLRDYRMLKNKRKEYEELTEKVKTLKQTIGVDTSGSIGSDFDD